MIDGLTEHDFFLVLHSRYKEKNEKISIADPVFVAE